MTFTEAVKTCLARKYATFSGRAARSEYWWFVLFCTLVNIAVSACRSEAASTILLCALLLPQLAAGARRLHDVGRSGWWQLIGLIPVVGWIILLIWFCSRGTAGSNKFDA